MELTKEQEEWIQALESGKYPKTTAGLCSGGSDPQYCCLGVACEIFHDRLGITKEPMRNNWTLYGGEAAFLPESVTTLLKLRSFTGLFESASGVGIHSVRALTSLNDGPYNSDKDFKRVAKFIRDNASKIFLN